MNGDFDKGYFAIDGVAQPALEVDPGLYVVSTPIGNLGDISIRALGILAGCDRILCEDTRVTRVLLDRYAIRNPLGTYHEHNANTKRPGILADLEAGRSIALVSDAGTPLLSDPGFRLVGEALEQGVRVTPVPGASALLAALVAAGLPTDAFFFGGFLPPKRGPRKKRLTELKAVPGSLIFYESPKRLAAALTDMKEILGGERLVAVARELTKAFETVRRGTLGSLASTYGGEAPPRGEIVIVIGPPADTNDGAIDLDDLLLDLLGEQSVRSAADEAAALTGLPRRQVYQRALALKSGTDGEA